jgi:hypothetical protein
LWLGCGPIETEAEWWRLPVVLAGLAVPILSVDGSLYPFPDDRTDNAVHVAYVGLDPRSCGTPALGLLRPVLPGAR